MRLLLSPILKLSYNYPWGTFHGPRMQEYALGFLILIAALLKPEPVALAGAEVVG